MRKRKVGTAFGGMLLLAATLLSAFPADAQIVCLGASNTVGKTVSRQDSYPAQLEVLLRAKGYTGQVANEGISGDTAWGMLSRLDHAVPPGTRVVIFEPDGNDARQGRGTDKAPNVAEIKIRLKARGVTVIMLEGIMTHAGGPRNLADGIHFNAEGYRLIASWLLPQVLQALGLPAG